MQIIGASLKEAIVKGSAPLVTPNCAKVSTTGIKPTLENPAAVEIILLSATPTSNDARDGALASGMTIGMEAGYGLLDTLLVALDAAHEQMA